MIEYLFGVIAGIGLVAIGFVATAIYLAIKNREKESSNEKWTKRSYIIYYEPNK